MSENLESNAQTNSNELPANELSESSNNEEVIPKQNRGEILALGEKTGRAKKIVEAHYSQISSLVKAAIKDGQDPESKKDKIIESLNKRAASFFEGSEQNKLKFDATLKKIEALSPSSDQELIDNSSYEIITSLYSIMSQAEQEKRSSEIMAEKFTPVNELLSYGKTRDEIHIHLAEARSRKSKETREIIKQGMHDLADIVSKDPEVRRISATSWIVAHPKGRKQLERLGFIYDGPISEEFRKRHFTHDNRPISSSHIDREDFLQRYKR